ncbi:MAG: site-specific integrase [Bacteroidaceae bacterium]|nr:site-specific integrase [Bacteroidaceae bacterium]
METINVICYKSKKLSNGESPLMIRICKDGKKKYVGLGISVSPRHWDFQKQHPRSNCPNYEEIKILIHRTVQEYREKAFCLKSNDREFTANTLGDVIGTKKKAETVNDVFLEYIEQLDREGRNGYSKSVRQVYNSLVKYNGHLELFFVDIDGCWLKRYEQSLRRKGLAENTIGIRLRTLRAIYNYAIEKGVASADKYPFKQYKVSKLQQETVKRALCKDDFERIINYVGKDKYQQFAIDIFAFTYYIGGINFVDIANLTVKNIQDGQLVYRRQKTAKLIKLPIPQPAQLLIDKYHSDSPFLFPIYNTTHITTQQKENRLHKVITKVNTRLKMIGKELDLSIPITTYVARHTQATVMKRAGVPTAVISQIMGHSSEKVTQIYLDHFDNEQIDEAMQHLL